MPRSCRLHGASAATWGALALGLALIYGLPWLGQRLAWPALSVIPSPLICVVVLTVLASVLGLKLPTVGDLGQLPDALPVFALPQVPVSLDTLRIILLPALAIAMVGLLESVLTAAVVDELTDTPATRTANARAWAGQYRRQLLWRHCGLRNDRPGRGQREVRRARAPVHAVCRGVSAHPHGGAEDWVSQVPVIALVAIMVMVSAETFDWKSLGALVRHPRLSSAAMLATVAVTIATHNLAAGVAVGVVLSGVFFAFKVSRMLDVRVQDDAADRSTHLAGVRPGVLCLRRCVHRAFDVLGAEGRAVVIDVTHAHFWDITAVAALDKVVERCATMVARCRWWA